MAAHFLQLLISTEALQGGSRDVFMYERRHPDILVGDDGIPFNTWLSTLHMMFPALFFHPDSEGMLRCFVLDPFHLVAGDIST